MNLKLWQKQNETSLQVVEHARNLLDDWRSAQGVRSHRATDSYTHLSGSSSGHVDETDIWQV
jgi:hypothetical protein